MPNLFLISSVVAAASKSTKPASGGSSYFLFIIVLLFVGVYFLFLRPRQRRMREQQQSSHNLAVGDEVISAGGILGTVIAIAGDEVVVEVSPGTTLTFWRRAVNLRSAVKGAPPGGATATQADEDDDGATYDDGVAYNEGGTYDEVGTYDEGSWEDGEHDADHEEHPTGGPETHHHGTGALGGDPEAQPRPDGEPPTGGSTAGGSSHATDGRDESAGGSGEGG